MVTKEKLESLGEHPELAERADVVRLVAHVREQRVEVAQLKKRQWDSNASTFLIALAISVGGAILISYLCWANWHNPDDTKIRLEANRNAVCRQVDRAEGLLQEQMKVVQTMKGECR